MKKDTEPAKTAYRGYKLLRQRKNGTLGPLFINCRQVIPIGVWLPAENHPRKGYAERMGWHITKDMIAPHLSKKGRVWAEVEFSGYEELKRPASQGTTWYLATWMKVVKLCNPS